MTLDLKPRNYVPGGKVLQHTYEVMLRDHPEAFDVIVFPALRSEENEINAVDAPEITLLDRDERGQTYGEPYKCRAIIAPEETLAFSATDSELLESFHSASEAVNLLLAGRGVRTYSIIQWLEYPDMDSEETVERTVYVAATRPVGHTMNTWTIHTCFPLFGEGEIPEVPEELLAPGPLPPDTPIDDAIDMDTEPDTNMDTTPENQPTEPVLPDTETDNDSANEDDTVGVL